MELRPFEIATFDLGHPVNILWFSVGLCIIAIICKRCLWPENDHQINGARIEVKEAVDKPREGGRGGQNGGSRGGGGYNNHNNRGGGGYNNYNNRGGGGYNNHMNGRRGGYTNQGSNSRSARDGNNSSGRGRGGHSNQRYPF